MDLVKVAGSILQDCRCYLESISSEKYSQPISLLAGGTIGKHTRHFIEFYQCMISQTREGSLNYDLRCRQHDIETNPLHAWRAIQEIIAQLDQLDLNQQIEVYSGEYKNRLISSVGRELLYNMEHSIHHLFTIRIGLQYLCPEIKLTQHFGVAPSTLSYSS